MADREEFKALRRAREVLHIAGAEQIPRMPWQPDGVPPEDAALVRWALWQANLSVGAASHEELRAALRLLGSARAELEGLETGVLSAARMEGMTWAEIADGLGVRSPQAAQQRLHRSEQRRLAEPGE